MGELFPQKKLTDEAGGDTDGEPHRPQFDLDLNAGVVRLVRRGGPSHDSEAKH